MRTFVPYVLQIASVGAHIFSPRGATGYPASNRPIPNEYLFANSTPHINSTAPNSPGKCGPSPLRILPFGASITYGRGSSDGNGYRKELKELLKSAGFEAEMVGSVHSGKMENNANEGHPGAHVHDMSAHIPKNSTFRPDIILINVGTNDALKNSSTPQNSSNSISKIENRMDSLLNQLFGSFHNTTIVLSTLVPTKESTADCNIRDVVNPKYRDIVRKRHGKGQHIVLADMYEKVGKGGLGKDGMHPNDEGYKSMAHVWYEALMGAKKMFC